MALKQLYVVCEGQTEETFTGEVLGAHFRHLGVETIPLLLPTKATGSRKHKGGLVSYAHVRRYLQMLLWQHHRDGAWITTMLDLYALPSDFPGYQAAANLGGTARVAGLEAAFQADISQLTPNWRFLAHLQLHEFEAILLSDPAKIVNFYPDRKVEIDSLLQDVGGLDPEHVNDGPNTAPSKRIIRHIPEFEGQKAIAGPMVALDIGLAHIRQRCPHFDGWVSALEGKI